MIIKKDIQLSFKTFDIISTYQNDPFVGHLSTPITKSNLVLSYLSSLSIYINNTSPFIKGLNIGLIHGYFLFGPFFSLGPLRATQANNLVAFLSTFGLIIFLSSGLLLYSFVLPINKNFKNFFTKKEWNQFTSGFLTGGFGGIICGYILLNFFTFQI